MPLKLKCPCGERLTAPESAAGKRGKCPKCGMRFVIPAPKVAKATAAPAAPAPVAKTPPSDSAGFDLDDDMADDFGDLLDDALNEPARGPAAEENPFASPTAVSQPEPTQRGGGSRSERTKLANGIKLVFWGSVLIVLGWVTIMVGFFIHPAVILVGMAMFFLSFPVTVVGRLICLAGPKNGAGKSLLIASVVCELVNVAVSVLVALEALPPPANVLSPLLGLSTLILFLLFLKAVNTSIGEPQLASKAKEVIMYIATTMGLLIAAPLAAMLVPLLTIVLGLAALVLMLVGFFKYLNLLQHTAEAVRP